MHGIDLAVSQADIDEGRPCSPTGCALALAGKRHFRARRVQVDGSGLTVHLPRSGRLSTYPLGQDAIIWARRFDTGLGVTPNTFRLDAPYTRSDRLDDAWGR